MTGHELYKLGIDKEKLKVLNDKWIAIYYANLEDPATPVILNDTDRSVAAYENLIDLQMRLPFIIPKKNQNDAADNNFIKRHIQLRHIPPELNHIEP